MNQIRNEFLIIIFYNVMKRFEGLSKPSVVGFCIGLAGKNRYRQMATHFAILSPPFFLNSRDLRHLFLPCHSSKPYKQLGGLYSLPSETTIGIIPQC